MMLYGHESTREVESLTKEDMDGITGRPEALLRFRRQEASDCILQQLSSGPSSIDESLVEDFRQLLFDVDPAVRLNAVRFFRKTGRREALLDLEELTLTETTSATVRDTAAATVEELSLA